MSDYPTSFHLDPRIEVGYRRLKRMYGNYSNCINAALMLFLRLPPGEQAAALNELIDLPSGTEVPEKAEQPEGSGRDAGKRALAKLHRKSQRHTHRSA